MDDPMYCQKVRRFSELAAKKNLGNQPQVLSKEEVKFLCTMVEDEMEELKQAKDVGEQADALVDAIYYLLDGAAKKGINLDPIFSIVHENNLTKVKNKKVLHSKEGKVLKPSNWKDPSLLIKKEIERQTKQGAFSNAPSSNAPSSDASPDTPLSDSASQRKNSSSSDK